MKKLITILFLLLAATFAFAQETKKEEKKAEDFNTVREYRNKVFEVRFRSPRDLYPSISLLGSGFKGAAIATNEELGTVTVRDFPENIAAIEDALKRLDRPVASSTDTELKISVIIGSKTPMPAHSVPDELAPVVKQLQSTLRYAHYGVMTTDVHRVSAGNGLNGSGVADVTLLGLTPNEERPVFYRYDLRGVANTTSGDRPAFAINRFSFSMNVPIPMGTSVQYQHVGFETPFTIRENEKVVIGTTTMGEKALIVVVSAGAIGGK